MGIVTAKRPARQTLARLNYVLVGGAKLSENCVCTLAVSFFGPLAMAIMLTGLAISHRPTEFVCGQYVARQKLAGLSCWGNLVILH